MINNIKLYKTIIINPYGEFTPSESMLQFIIESPPSPGYYFEYLCWKSNLDGKLQEAVIEKLIVLKDDKQHT